MRVTIGVRCMAKLNLTLSILGTMSDGYHEVDTLYHSVDIDDHLFFTFDDSSDEVKFASKGNDVPSEFPLDESNLIIKAIRLYQKEVPKIRHIGVEVQVSKQIPMGAGLAGGSANAAAALYAMNISTGKALTTQGLKKLATLLGADVPFCLRGGTAHGKNRGEILQQIPFSSKLYFLVAKPKYLSLSTQLMFEAFDEQKKHPEKRGNTKSAIIGMSQNNLKKLAKSMGNDFEELAFDMHPQLRYICADMLDNSALAAHLTGSGPTVFGLYDNESNLQRTKEILSLKYKDISIWCCASAPYGVAGLGVLK